MKKKILLTAIVLTLLFIPKIVYADDRIHFINSRDGDGIIIETTVDGTTHYGLVDALNPSKVLQKEDEDEKNMTDAGTGELIESYIKKLDKNFTKFDFIIMTHNHYDHIGGIPILANYINKNTLVFYKNDVEPIDDLEFVNNKNSNHYFFTEAKKIIDSKQAITCDVTSAKENGSRCNINTINGKQKEIGSFVKKIKYDANEQATSYNTNVKEKIEFTFGNFKIEMYSLYPISNHAENINSIVTLVTHNTSGKKAALTGDILTGPVDIDNSELINKNKSQLIINPTGTCNECKDLGVENQIADAIGKVDLLKSAHHGGRKSNSIDALIKYAPEYYITTYGAKIGDYDYVVQDFNEANIVAMTYLDSHYETKSYFTSQADGAIVAEFSTDSLAIKGYNKDGIVTNKELEDASKVIYRYKDGDKIEEKTGRIASYGKNIKDYVYMYLKSGKPVKNDFVNDGNEKYYMYWNGLMYTGWKKIDNKWYYFRKYKDEISKGSHGSAVKDWAKIDGKWYYFDKNARMVTGLYTAIDGNVYYLSENYSTIGQMQTGWQKVKDNWYYFRKEDNDIAQGIAGSALKGWQTINNNWYYFNNTGKMVTGLQYLIYNNRKDYYYFEENSVTAQGIMQTGWIKIGDYWYFFRKANTDNGEPKGSAITGLATINSRLYYFRQTKDEFSTGPQATMYKGLATINGSQYYFREAAEGTEPEGSALKNACKKINNTNYCFDSDGKALKIIAPPTTSMCKDITYTGKEQTITKTTATGYTWSNNKKTNAGSYNVTATLKSGYIWSDETTSTKTIKCSIKKKKLEIPTANPTNYTYTGNVITPTINNYSSTFESVTGTSSATNVGSYSITYALKDKTNTCWKDGTTTNVTLSWKITKRE